MKETRKKLELVGRMSEPLSLCPSASVAVDVAPDVADRVLEAAEPTPDKAVVATEPSTDDARSEAAPPVDRVDTDVHDESTVTKKRTRTAYASDDLLCAESLADEPRDLYAFDTNVVGRFNFPEAPEPTFGDVITFERQPTNKHDKNAVLVRVNGHYCGYVQAASVPTCTGSTHARAISELIQLEMNDEPLVVLTASVATRAMSEKWRFVVDISSILLNVTVATKHRGAALTHAADTVEATLARHGIASKPCA